jgi:quinol monooxygenase YgiN
MRSFTTSIARSLAAGLVVVMLGAGALPVSAEPLLRVVRFTAAGPEQQQAVLKLIDTEINPAQSSAKGFKSAQYYYDPDTLVTGSVVLWNSKEDMEAYLASDYYKAIIPKLVPLLKGPIQSDNVRVHVPPKPKKK